MTPDDRRSERLTAGLTDLAGTSTPDYRNDILRQVARTRQRPALTFLERWIPMPLVARGRAEPRPLTRSSRQTWQLIVVLALTLALVAGLAVAGARLLLPAPPDRGFNSLVTVPVFESDTSWDPSGIDGLLYPVGMDIGPDGNLYVVSAGTSEVLVVDPLGAVVRRWGTRGTGDGQFDFQRDPQTPNNVIGGVAVAPAGSVYVADTVNDRIQQFTASGSFVRQWGDFGPANGQFLDPIDVAAGPDGTVFVVDDRRDDIQSFTADGNWLASIGIHGTADGQLNSTGGVDVDGSGAIMNADFGNHRIQAWDRTGEYLWSHATGVDGGPVSEPLDVAAATDGTLYISDGAGIHVLGADLSPLNTWTPPAAEGPAPRTPSPSPLTGPCTSRRSYTT